VWVSGSRQCEVAETIESPRAVQVNLADGKLHLSTNGNAHFHGFSIDGVTRNPPEECTFVSHGILSSADWSDITPASALVPDTTYYLTPTPGQIAPLPIVGNIVFAGHALTPTDLLIAVTPTHNVLPLYSILYSQFVPPCPVVLNTILVSGTWHSITASGTNAQRTVSSIYCALGPPNSALSGRHIILQKDVTSPGDVIIGDNNVGGNIQSAGNFTLTSEKDKIGFIFDGTHWCELFRSNNA